MADEDEIDVLGDFSFNSCFAQNNQGIPSCSSREDTVHPQWLLDSTETNWYDKQSIRKNIKEGSPKKLYGNNSGRYHNNVHSSWSQAERDLLIREMAKYGRNTRKISQTLKTKSEAEIQALIEAEIGVNLDTPSFGLDKPEDHDDVPTVVQEEIVTDEGTGMDNVLQMVSTGSPTITLPKKPFRKKNAKSLLKPNLLFEKETEILNINPSEILYEDDLILGSTESIGSELDLTDIVSKNIVKHQAKVKAEKKIGNHRRKGSRNFDNKIKKISKNKELPKSPQGRQRKDSSLSEESLKSPKMQIVFSSGQSLPVSEGEEVIKIEKKKDSDPESDIDIDVDSDNDNTSDKSTPKKEQSHKAMNGEVPIAVPLSRFEPMPRRKKKLNLDGGGGYTIMHTETGDLLALGAEPKVSKGPKKQHVQLLHCRVYNSEKPAPFSVLVHVSTLLQMDAHAHTSRAEVMGLVGGELQGEGQGHTPQLTVSAYRAAAAAAGSTHCDMDPVSQSRAAESLRQSHLVCGWHHSHPQFPSSPSALDLQTQRGLQQALEWRVPFLGFITSQHWPTGRNASQYRCIRVEEGEDPEVPVGYQFSVKLVADLSVDNLATFLQELRGVMLEGTGDQLSVDMVKDKCPQAGITYLEKFISSASHHMRSAGYTDEDPVVIQLIQGIRDVFR